MSELLVSSMTENEGEKLVRVGDKLKEMYRRSLVKSNHSVMELVVCSYLIKKGYTVDVERGLDSLVCDVYATRGDGTLIVEVETGFVPPEHSLDPVTYQRARLASKIARYSQYSDRFVLATPVDNLMDIFPLFVKPPRERTEHEVYHVKELVDKYYTSPPVSQEEILNAKLHGIMVVNVDEMRVTEVDPQTYLDLISRLPR
jgi:hypothetical protein